ncbi:ABC transporter ATP-binding protein [Natrononativus amylolyticus]|uniref:ABC transporter ATP-binding protein n=1 Tax=Natrononativus amylolyticus TaxID=2963434 RepID=UPI0020CBF2AF|nr:sn-glycerol-3-phosphate ABC transporter ATP-binding protein UgpC [Natrononativus amylolyticus]
MSHLSIDGVSKVFSSGEEGEIVAVDDVSMEIEDGEFLVMVGPSGSGKSTLLRLIAGLETVSEGEFYLGDERITGKKPKNRDLAMVFQNYALYPHLSARNNIGFGLKMQGGIPKDEINRRVEEAAEIMEIGDLLEKMPNELSGGQQQRVSLGRAIVRDPEVFLMDEPLSNLDAKLRTTMRTEIQQLQDELGVTTIYVTHDQVEAMTMGDRIAILNQGELQQVATPIEAYYEPQNRFVAGFIGSPSMNFIDVAVDRSGGTTTFEHADFSYVVSELVAAKLPEEVEEVTVGIRPEDLEVNAGGPDEYSFTTGVSVVEPLGKEQLGYFDLGTVTYTASVPGYYDIEEGQTISVHVPPERLHLFDVKTGDTIANREPPGEEERESATQAMSDR